MLQTSLLLMKSLSKTETPIFYLQCVLCFQRQSLKILLIKSIKAVFGNKLFLVSNSFVAESTKDISLLQLFVNSIVDETNINIWIPRKCTIWIPRGCSNHGTHVQMFYIAIPSISTLIRCIWRLWYVIVVSWETSSARNLFYVFHLH